MELSPILCVKKEIDIKKNKYDVLHGEKQFYVPFLEPYNLFCFL